MSGPVPYPESTPPQGFPPYPSQQVQPGGAPFAGAYPGALPPPLQYPKRKPWRVIATAVGAVAIIAAVVGSVMAVWGRGGEPGAQTMTAENVQPAIQGFLDALTDGDDQAVARHALCGLYDAVTDRSSDLALADLSSDAFRKQFTEVEVTSVDTVVPWSTNQAQALFTMQVVAPGTGRASADTGTEMQVVAQLLQTDDEILVCSYVQRAG